MTPEPDDLSMAGLRFSGTVTAAFTHDFKNALAIIKENNGLLQDLIAMAERGRPLDPERIAVLAERIGRQVERADRMTSQLNRFAHSADRPRVETDLAVMLEMAAVLAGRKAALKRVTIEPVPPATAFRVSTFPFALQHLIYRCIESLLDGAGSGGRIVLEVQGGQNPVAMRLTACTADGRPPFDGATPPVTSEMATLAGALKIRLDREQTAGWQLAWNDTETQKTTGL